MKRAVFSALLVLLLLLPVLGWATDWYCRPAGGNYGNEDGTSYENAWDGTSNIDWSEIQSGDTLWICGVHDGEGALHISSSGITVKSYPSDPGVIKNNYRNLVIYEGCNNITIDGLELGAADDVGAKFYYTNNLVLKNLYVHNSGSHGLDFTYDVGNGKFCTNVQILNCVFSHCGNEGSAGRGIAGRVGGTSTVKSCIFEYSDDNGSSLCPAQNGTVLTFWYCISRFNGDNGFGMASNTEAGCTINWKQCRIYGNTGSGILIHSNYDSQVYIEYCLIYNNTSGIVRQTDCKSELYLYNNTIAENTVSALKIFSDPKVEAYNNIFFRNGTSAGSDRYEIAWLDTNQTLVSDHNCMVDDAYNNQTIHILADDTYNTFEQWQSGHGQQYDQHSFNDNPLLTSAYRLSPNSPCIDAGVRVAGVHTSDWCDLDGNTVRYGTAPDIGCFEYHSWPRTGWGLLPWIGKRFRITWGPLGG